MSWISSYSGWCNKWLASKGNPLEPCTWIISRTIWDRTNKSMEKCAPRWEEQSINSVFHFKTPGSQVMVGDVTIFWRVMETRWNLVLELSREPFEIVQIYQWQKCAPRWEEQSINRVFHCKSPGSQVIVGDVTNWWRVMETRWNLELGLSREPFEIEQKSQLLKCAPRWEEQSINSVFHCKSPGSQVIVGDVTNFWRVMETRWNLVLEL